MDFSLVFRQIMVRILQMLPLGVSSNGRVFISLCETQGCSENLPETGKTKHRERQFKKGFLKREKMEPFFFP